MPLYRGKFQLNLVILVFKGAMLQGFCSIWVKSVLKSLLSTFSCTKNAPTEFQRKHQNEI